MRAPGLFQAFSESLERATPASTSKLNPRRCARTSVPKGLSFGTKSESAKIEACGVLNPIPRVWQC